MFSSETTEKPKQIHVKNMNIHWHCQYMACSFQFCGVSSSIYLFRKGRGGLNVSSWRRFNFWNIGCFFFQPFPFPSCIVSLICLNLFQTAHVSSSSWASESQLYHAKRRVSLSLRSCITRCRTAEWPLDVQVSSECSDKQMGIKSSCLAAVRFIILDKG